MSVRGRITLVLLIGAMLALYWPAVQSLWVIWLDVNATTYTHGLLIAALSLWLLWFFCISLTTKCGTDSYRYRRWERFLV